MECSNILRVISGTAKGHKLKTPKGMNTRPTTDMIKESLFNILQSHIPGARVLDLFAGTGSLGIEALSRGASLAVFVDSRIDCVSIIRENLEHTKLTTKAEIYRSDWKNALLKLGNSRKFDVIFLDPPYHKNFLQQALNSLSINDIINDEGIIAVERSKSDKLEIAQNLELIEDRLYGETALSFYKKTAL